MIKLAMRLFLFFSILSFIVPQKIITDYSDYGWAVFLNQIGKTDIAKQTLLKHKNKDVFYYNKLGEFEGVNYKKALYYFKKGEKIDPAEPLILKNLGKTYFFMFFKSKKSSDITDAKKYLKRYLKTNKNDFLMNYIYGESLKFTGEITKGVDYLVKAYMLNPSATRILKEIINIKLSLKDYLWFILNYKQYKLLNYLNSQNIGKILGFISDLKLKSSDKNYKKIQQFIDTIKPEGDLNILKKLVVINFKNRRYSKVIELYRKNINLFEQTPQFSITRFYLFSLYYSKNYYDFSKEVNKRFKKNPDSDFYKYLLSRYYYTLGYIKLPYIYIKDIEKPVFISDNFYRDYESLVKIRYYLLKKDTRMLRKILTDFDMKKIRRASVLLKASILKASLFTNNTTLLKSILQDKNHFLKLIYIINTKTPDEIIDYIKSYPKFIPNILNELVNGKRFSVLHQVLKNIDKKLINDKLYNFYTGRYFEHLGKYKKAYKYYKKAIKENPSLSYLNYYTYFSLINNYKIQNQKYIIERFIKEGNSAAVFDTLGLLLIKDGKLKKGENYLLKAYILTPQDKLIKMHLADFYYKIENYKRALYFYKSSSEGECFTDEYKANIERIKKRIKRLEKINFNIKNYSGLYSIKIYINGKSNPLRLKIKYNGDNLLLSFYHFPMTKMADIYVDGDTIFINHRDKRFYEGEIGDILKNIIGINIDKNDILKLLGIKEGIVFLPYNDIEVSSYKKGLPEKIEIKGGKIRVRIKLIKYDKKTPVIIKKPNTNNLNEVFDIKEVLGE